MDFRCELRSRQPGRLEFHDDQIAGSVQRAPAGVDRNIELNENMESAYPLSIPPSGAQRTLHVGRFRVGSFQIPSHTPVGAVSWCRTLLPRFNPNGSPDSVFGSNGTVLTPGKGPSSVALLSKATTVLSGNAGINSLLIEANGDILAIGGVFNPSTGVESVALTRYLGT
jgi:hypothetical protein